MIIIEKLKVSFYLFRFLKKANKNLKNFLKKNKFIYRQLQQIKKLYESVYLKYFAGSKEEIFKNIYLKNKWLDKDSVSGTGSNLEQTKNLKIELSKFIRNKEIKSILDIPCGDFYWMKEVNLDKIDYIGADIVPDLIYKNRNLYSKENISFEILDITKDQLPSSDIIFCRDCLVHLSFEDIFKSLNNIKKGSFKFFITTNFLNREINEDIETGSWRTINFYKSPFNFPESIEDINEKCTEAGNKYTDKVLSVWNLDSIPFYYKF